MTRPELNHHAAKLLGHEVIVKLTLRQLTLEVSELGLREDSSSQKARKEHGRRLQGFLRPGGCSVGALEQPQAFGHARRRTMALETLTV